MQSENSDRAAFIDRWCALRARCDEVAVRCGRPAGAVRLMAVTKTQTPAAMTWAAQAGLSALGENRVQEAARKWPAVHAALTAASVAIPSLELIGPLQTNKARLAVHLFDRLQTVDRPKLAGMLNRLGEERGRPVRLLMQVNSGRDPAKSGVEPEEAESLLSVILASPWLQIEGLMAIAPLTSDASVARHAFRTLREIRDRLSVMSGLPLAELSMGMSGDWESAVAEGSTLVRIGSALFGERPSSDPPVDGLEAAVG